MYQQLYQFRPSDPGEITARSLVLSLLAGSEVPQISISRLIRAGTLFNIEAATMRVAVTRLMQSGHLESSDRGVYVPGPRSRALTTRVQKWKDVNDRKRDWDGEWLTALTQHLGRTNRKQVRARERALALSGYRETPQNFWVRSANLARDLQDHRNDLISIGADEGILIHRVCATASGEEAAWPGLWSVDVLRESYDRAIRTMEDSMKLVPDLPATVAAKETFLVGQSVIRAINYDPLLPKELGPDHRFRDMVMMMRTYNKVGIACWLRFDASA